MHWGFRIVEDMIEGMSNWMDDKGFKSVYDFVGKSLPRISTFGDFDLGFQSVARIDHANAFSATSVLSPATMPRTSAST